MHWTITGVRQFSVNSRGLPVFGGSRALVGMKHHSCAMDKDIQKLASVQKLH